MKILLSNLQLVVLAAFVAYVSAQSGYAAPAYSAPAYAADYKPGYANGRVKIQVNMLIKMGKLLLFFPLNRILPRYFFFFAENKTKMKRKLCSKFAYLLQLYTRCHYLFLLLLLFIRTNRCTADPTRNTERVTTRATTALSLPGAFTSHNLKTTNLTERVIKATHTPAAQKFTIGPDVLILIFLSSSQKKKKRF